MIFITLYNTIIYQPLLNLLVFVASIVPGHDMGIVIIVVTIIIRLALAPAMHKSLKGQQKLNDIQPKLNELRDQHKDNKEAQAKAMMDLYKEHKINPLSSCLPILVQLPLLIALYQVFSKALKGNLEGLYSFVSRPEFINPKLFGLVDLSQPSIYFAILAGVLQFWQSKMMLGTNKSTDATAQAMAIQSIYVLPVLSVFIAWKLPAGLPLYWIVTTLFAIAQQYYIKWRTTKPTV